MATDDDGPSFSYAWNPALRPDSAEPQNPSRYSAPPSKPQHGPVNGDLSEDSAVLPPSAADLHPPDAPSLASRYNLEFAEPTSDDDFFDRYGSSAEPASIQNGLPHQKVFGADGMDSQHIAPIAAEHVVGAGDLMDGQEPPAQTETPALHAHETNQHHERPAVGQKPNDTYDFQGESTLLEDAVQESSKAPLASYPEPTRTTSIDWGNDNETFDFGATQESTAPPMASPAPPLEPETSNTMLAIAPAKEVPSSLPSKKEADIDWGASDDQAFDFGATAVTEPTIAGAAKDAGDANTGSQSEDLSAMWQAALGDDDLLADSGKGGWAAFDDGEGFLENEPQPIAAITTASAPQPTKSSMMTNAKPNKYAPVETQQPTAPPSNPYHPDRPQFTDFSQLNRPSSSRAPAPSPYQMAYAQEALQRPPLQSSAESFSDKAKGGYHSPYDLPEDLTKQPRRRLIHHAPSMPALQSMQPPPRSSSITSSAQVGPPRTRPPSSGASQNLTPPSSSHSSQAPTDFAASKATSPTKPTDRRGSSEFFADLPEVRSRRHPTPSGRYTPMSPAVQTPPLNQAPPPATRLTGPPAPILKLQGSVPSLAAQLRPPEKIPLYSDEQQGAPRSVTMPAPPPSTRYSPALPMGAPTVKPRYSPAPTAAPAAAPPPATRYSPAPTTTSSHHAYPPQASAPPRAPAQAYVPRTSSPLTFSTLPQQQAVQQAASAEPAMPTHESPVYQRSSFDRSSSLTGHLPLEPVSEDGPFIPTPPVQADSSPLAHATISPRSGTPPMAGQRSGPPSAVSSPRKRANYTPQHVSTGPLSDPGFAPPPRSHTSSPGKIIKQPQLRMMSLDRPASAHGQLPTTRDFTTPAVIQAGPRRPGVAHDANLIPPQNETANDPLQRWKGSPIFNWANGGTVVTSFPQLIPRYGSGFIGPAVQPQQGEVKIRSGRDWLAQSNTMSKFPGPLKKGKKKEVSAWLKGTIEELERYVQSFNMQSGFPGVDVRMEEKVLLWKVVALLVEHDGVLEGKPAVEEAVRSLFSITPPVDHPSSAGGLNGNQAPTVLPDAFDPNALSTLRTHLYQGEREKAVWHAVDQRLWAHALLIASTLPREIWKQVVQEFVRKEISKAGDINQPVAALYQVFAGNWEESIDELVSVSARAGFQMVSTSGSGAPKDALAGLNKWRDTLLLVLNNRSPSDVNALLSLGRLLRGYGRIEASHICFLFARSVAYFGGAEDPQADFTLLGGNPFTEGSDLGRDLDSLLLSEAYEFALTLSPTPISPIPHLQAYKLYHAEILAESGHRAEAQQYCDAIAAMIHSKTKPSPYFNVHLMQRLDELGKRLSQAPSDGSSWKPSMDKVSSSLWGKFNSFVTGDDNDAASNASGQGADSGNFVRMKGDTPDLSRQASGTDLYGAMMSNGAIPPSAPVNSRYAPLSANSSRTSLEQPSHSRYAPASQGGYQPRTSLESTRSTYEPSSGGNTTGLGLPVSPQRAASYNAAVSPQNSYTAPSSFQLPGTSSAPPVLPVEPPTFSAPSYTPSPYQPTPPEETLDHPAASFNSYQPIVPDEPTSSYLPASFDSYHPSTGSYEPPVADEPAAQSSYEPPTSYQPYEPPSAPEETQPSSPDDAPKPKKKSFMDDDDDDDLFTRAEALKKQKRAEADRAADDAFRKAAEADAARGAPAVAEKKGWFGGWFGKKDPNAPQTGPIRAKLGEENSFVFDKELGKWVNKKAGVPGATSVSATPPPPKMTPRLSSGLGAANGGLGAPPTSAPTRIPGPGGVSLPVAGAGVPPPMGMASGNRAASVPPPMMARQDSQASSGSAPPPLAGAPPLAAGGPPSGPPSRPATSMSNASDLDDLLGAPGGPRRGGKKAATKKGRYVDVMANQK